MNLSNRERQVMTRTVIAPKIGSENFTWVKDPAGFGGLFVIEMSQLKSLIGGMGRIWDNAVDVGLVLVSKRTGSEAIFVATSFKSDEEGELMFWTLSPTFSSYQKNRQLQHVEIRIYNT